MFNPYIEGLKLQGSDRNMSSSGSPSSSSTPPSGGHASDNNNDSSHHHGIVISPKLEIVILLLLLFGFAILAARPFGFRTFLASMGHGALYHIVIVFGIIAVILVLMQRLRIIFVESSEEHDTQ